MSPTFEMHEVQRLPTHGARAVEPFVQDGITHLVVPQLAADLPGQPPSMTQGDSDVPTLVYRWERGRCVEHQRLDVPGGEDAEAFTIGGRRFLATASLRRGRGPYEMAVDSTLFEWRGGRFEPFQTFPTHAAKQWTHLELEGRHFLALAQGVALPGEPAVAAPSCLYAWNGQRFEPFQTFDDTAWGYNFHFMRAGGRALLAYADHARPSRVLAWDGRRFETLQEFDGGSGRAFEAFDVGGQSWLAFARLLGDSELYRWDGTRYVRHQTLSGPGGREFAWRPDGDGGGHLVQVNFIHGSREAPQPVLESVVHAWRGDGFEPVRRFGTSGGTDAAFFDADGATHLAVSNSLDAGQRFRTDCVIYRLA